jgi:hypothetical protein
MLTIGGSEQTTPIQARVMILGAAPSLTHETMAVGVGKRQVPFLISRFMNYLLLLVDAGILADNPPEDNPEKPHHVYEE